MICTACNERFGGITAFDLHRSGKYPVANHKHPVPVGETATKWRRCLSADEMREKGLHQDGKGKWVQSYGNPQRQPLPRVIRRIAA